MKALAMEALGKIPDADLDRLNRELRERAMSYLELGQTDDILEATKTLSFRQDVIMEQWRRNGMNGNSA